MIDSPMHGAMQDYPLTLDRFLQHAARWHPDAEVVTALPEGRCRIGYAALAARAKRLSGLLADLGVRTGDHVATLAWNSQAHLEAWYAIMGMGAVCHTLNPRLTAQQLTSMTAQSQPRLLIASADLAQLALAITNGTPNLPQLLLIDGDTAPAGAGLLEPLLAATTKVGIWGNFSETAPCGLCFTSGTTGTPKGVTYTHRSSFLHALRLLQADGMAISSAETVLAAVPMFHANAWGLPFAAAAAGARLVLPGRNTDGASLARLIAAENVTVAVGVPTLWLNLVEHLEATGDNLPSLSRVIVGGAPMPPALMERIEKRLGVSVQTSWGMTELSPLGTVMRPHDPARQAALAGRPDFSIDLRLADNTGQPLRHQRGVEGHLQVRGAAVVGRYFGQNEPATDQDGWFSTGDLAVIGNDGTLSITGRTKDLIKSGGEWINPAEIEALVGAQPQVAQAAVIGRSDPKWGERPVLLVELRDAAVSDDDLLAPLRGRIAPWWIPDAVIRLKAMPLAATGKIDKIRLRTDHGQA